MKITKNIYKNELKCRCGHCEVYIQSHEPVIYIVQDACDHFAKAHGVKRVVLMITSSARCYEYNRQVGSDDEDQHPRCKAMKFKLFLTDGTQIPPAEVYKYLNSKYPGVYGMSAYKNFTHIDTRSGNGKRW